MGDTSMTYPRMWRRTQVSVSTISTPDLLDRYKVEGGTWGIPAGVIPRVVFYNQTLFDAAGVAHPGRAGRGTRSCSRHSTSPSPRPSSGGSWNVTATVASARSYYSTAAR